MIRSRLCVLDTETTGLPRDGSARVVELGAVILDTDGAEIASFSALCRPDVYFADTAREALAINGIAEADVLAAAPSRAVRQDFLDWLTKHQCGWVTAYNVEFDREMCRRMGFAPEWPKWGPCIMLRSVPALAAAGKLRPADPTHPRYRPDMPWLFPSLALAAEHFGVTPEGQAHRALTDAMTAARVLLALIHP